MTIKSPERLCPITRAVISYEEKRRAALAASRELLGLLELPYAAEIFIRVGRPWHRVPALAAEKGCGRLILDPGPEGPAEEFKLDNPRLYERPPYTVIPVVATAEEDEEAAPQYVGWVLVTP